MCSLRSSSSSAASTGASWRVAEFDLVATLVGLEFGETNAASRIVYGLVGLAAVYQIAQPTAMRRRWASPRHRLTQKEPDHDPHDPHRHRRRRALALAVPAATAAPAERTASPSIAALATKTPQLSTLLSLVKKAGLADELAAPGALTVFAPTNAAFAKVPKATLNGLAKNPAALKRVLLYHIVAGQAPGGEGRHAPLGEDPRRPGRSHPRHRQDRPDQ